MTGGSICTYVNTIYRVDSLASCETLALPCYVLDLSFTLGISQINDREYMKIHEFFILGGKNKTKAIIYIQVSQEIWPIFWEVIVLVILKKKFIYTYVLWGTLSQNLLFLVEIFSLIHTFQSQTQIFWQISIHTLYYNSETHFPLCIQFSSCGYIILVVWSLWFFLLLTLPHADPC